MVGFIFGSKDKDKPWSYEELQRKRAMAETLAASMGTPKNVGEGLAAIGKALAARGINKKASAEEARMREEFERKWGSLFSGMGGGGASYAGGGSPSGTWTPDAPPPSPVDVAAQGMPVAQAGGLTFGADKPKADPGMIGGGKEPLDFGAAVMTPQEMLIEGAKMRGLDPIDVATAISYETGGKFDPMIAGPTTQWGTHRGLIQFGEPQAKQHGVDFSNPDAAWRSQLNPETGAVWDYLDSTGVKAGMGLPEIYSAINAGAVGRMNASDANNGGAPGTVADKVAGMAPHRDKAAQFLGGTWTPAEGESVSYAAKGAPGGGGGFGGGGMNIGALVALASDPMASPAQRGIVEALIQQQMSMMDPMRAIEMEKAQLELAQMKDGGQNETLMERTALADAAGLQGEARNVYIATGDLPPEPKETARPLTDPAERAQWGIPPTDTRPYAIEPGKAPELVGDSKGTTVSVDVGGEEDFAKAFAQGDAKTAGEIYNTGLAAQRNIGRIDQLAALLEANPTGAGAALAVAAGEWGINTEGLDELQTAQAIINSLVPEQRQPGSGPMSDADLALFKQSLPRIINQPGGNKMIVDTMRAIAQYDAEGAQIVQRMRLPKDDPHFLSRDQAFDALQNRPNPLADFKGSPASKATDERTTAPDGIDQDVWDALTPEERALWD
jgi:hypothetical protein